MINRAKAKRLAREQVKSSFLMLCLIAFIPTLIASAVTGLTAGIGSVIAYLGTPMLLLGMTLVFINAATGEAVEFSQVFAYHRQWWSAFCLYFLTSLFIGLWSCLLIIPGIIAGLRYSMAYYIMAENPEITASKAIALSKEMTSGHLWELALFHLSFFGWYLLSLATCGLALVWVVPYANAAQANVYLMLKKEFLG